MKQPHKNLPKNNLSKAQHQRAGQVAVTLMSKPVQRQNQSKIGSRDAKN